MKLGLTDNQYKNLLTLLQEQAEAPAAEPEKGTSDKQAGGQGYPAVGKWESGVTRGPGNQVGVTKWADVVGAKLNRGKANPLKEQTTQPTSDTQNKSANFSQENVYLGVDQPTEPIPAIEKYPNQCQYYEYGKCPYEMKTKGGDIYFWYYHSVGPVNHWSYVGELHGEVPGLGDYKLGNYNNNDFVGNQKDMMDYYESELDWWLQANMNTTLEEFKRYKGRLSKNGVEVPKGFDPDRYDEYLSKIGPIQQQIKSIDKKHKFNWNPLKPMGNRVWDQKELDDYNNLKQQLVNLKNEYYNEQFSYGITKFELDHYNDNKKVIIDDFNNKVNLIKSKYGEYDLDRTDNTKTYNQTANTELPGEDNKLKKQRDNELKPIYDQYQKDLSQLDVVFGKDDWIGGTSIFGEKFDNFWDKWGGAIQTVGNIAVIALSGGIAGVVEGTAGAIGFVFQSGILRAVAPYAVDATFNALVGTYEASRGKNANSVVSFLCAMIPFISYGRNIGKVSIDVAEGLSKKVLVGKFDTKESMEIFVKSLTPEERYVFRNVMSLPKELIKSNFDKSVAKLSKDFTKEGVKVAKAGAPVWVPKFLAQLGFEGGPPVATQVINGFFNIIKENYGHLFTQDELIQIKQKLNNLEKEDTMKNLVAFSESLNKLKEKEKSGKSITKQDIKDGVQSVVDKDLKEITPQQLQSIIGSAKEIIKKGKNK